MTKLIIPFFLIMLLGLQHRLWIGDGSLMVIHNYHQQIAKLADKAQRIEAENQEMSIQVSQMRNSLSAVESLARYDLGMIARNEEFFLFDKK